MNKKRIFLALTPPEKLLQNIADWQNTHKDIFGVRYIKHENLHLTVLPPWYEKGINLGIINELISCHLKDLQSVVIQFNRIETKANCLWLSAVCPSSFARLREKLASTLNLKFEMQTTPHITLARLKKGASYQKFWRDPIATKACLNQLVLFESILEQEGAKYVKVFEWNLPITT